jgi:hypothetical protein
MSDKDTAKDFAKNMAKDNAKVAAEAAAKAKKYNAPPPPPTPEERQKMLDEVAQAKKDAAQTKEPNQTTLTEMGKKAGGSIKFGRGGMPAAINKQNTQHGSMDMPFKSLKKFTGMKEGGMARGGMSKAMASKGVSPKDIMAAINTRRPMQPSAPPMAPPAQPGMGMKKGGSTHKMPNGEMMKNSAMNSGGGIRGKSGYVGMGKKENPTDGSSTAGENPKIQKRGLTEGRVIKMASGGSVDGIAQRGKTRGKMC